MSRLREHLCQNCCKKTVQKHDGNTRGENIFMGIATLGVIPLMDASLRAWKCLECGCRPE